MKEVPSDPEWATNFTSSMLRKLKNDYPDAFQEKERDNTAFYVFAVLCFYYQICKVRSVVPQAHIIFLIATFSHI